MDWVLNIILLLAFLVPPLICCLLIRLLRQMSEAQTQKDEQMRDLACLLKSSTPQEAATYKDAMKEWEPTFGDGSNRRTDSIEYEIERERHESLIVDAVARGPLP